MFYFDYVKGRKVLKSDILDGLEHFFTTRELCLFSKEEDMSANWRLVEDYLGKRMAMNQPIHGVDIAKVERGKYFRCIIGREWGCVYEFWRLYAAYILFW